MATELSAEAYECRDARLGSYTCCEFAAGKCGPARPEWPEGMEHDDCDSLLGCAACAWEDGHKVGHAAGVQAGHDKGEARGWHRGWEMGRKSGVQAGRDAAAKAIEAAGGAGSPHALLKGISYREAAKIARGGTQERPQFKITDGNRVTLACDDCGTLNNFQWTADDDVWAAVAAGHDQEHPVLCANCFASRAKAVGLGEFWLLVARGGGGTNG